MLIEVISNHPSIYHGFSVVDVPELVIERIAEFLSEDDNQPYGLILVRFDQIDVCFRFSLQLNEVPGEDRISLWH